MSHINHNQTIPNEILKIVEESPRHSGNPDQTSLDTARFSIIFISELFQATLVCGCSGERVNINQFFAT